LPTGLPLSELPAENETLCIAFYGKGEDFYTLKSAVAEALALFRTEYTLEYADCPYLHPGISAKITSEEGAIGVFGKIHPLAAKNFDVPEDVFLAHIHLEPLLIRSMPDIRYVNLPKFPAVERDLAITVKEEVTVGQLMEWIKRQELCEYVELFDVYRGAQIEPGLKSVAFSIRLRADDRTLNDEEIKNAMNEITASLLLGCKAKLRV